MPPTGVVFALLLSGLQEDLQTSASWVDFVPDKLTPGRPRRRLARGADVDWYSYPFVDLAAHGYGGVLGRAVVLAAGFAAAGAALLWAANRGALR